MDEIPPTGYWPSSTNYILIARPPVGGVILPMNLTQKAIPSLLVGLIILSVTMGIKKKNRFN
jgi:hypothetical protein